ncbi:MAG: hypothetical protein SGI86_11930 [Deltaproteobacteria bacterium]|nr:hypothetical protein [Deltaproteobacteria bacterium]
MTKVLAHVSNGRFVVDQPTDLPEGMAVQLLVLDAENDLSDSERAARDASIDRGLDEMIRGDVRPADEVFSHVSKRDETHRLLGHG